MGGKPIMALAILGMPLGNIPTEMVREILKGGAAVCAQAGIPIAGGHSIDCPEPVYGLAVIGICRPEQVRRNADARAGDALILTKAVGVGIYSAAIKKNALPPAGYPEMIATTKPRATRDGRYRLRRSESSVASVVIWLATTIRITNGRAPSFAVRDACGSVERHPVAADRERRTRRRQADVDSSCESIRITATCNEPSPM